MNAPLPKSKPAFAEEVDALVEFTDPPGGRPPAFAEEVDALVEFTDPTESPKGAGTTEPPPAR
ncbi:MAG: hypothetical protein U0871_05705 [Gemmataceae bacterium]